LTELVGGSRDDFKESSPHNFCSRVDTTGVVQTIGEFLKVTPYLLETHGDYWRRVWGGGGWRRNKGEMTSGKLRGFLYNFSFRVSTLRGHCRRSRDDLELIRNH